MLNILFCILIFGAISQATYCQTLQAHLLNQAQVDTDNVRLEQIALLAGDSAQIEKSKSLVLGSFTAAGQTLKIDRQTILSRLASLGIETSEVVFSGAQTVAVGRNETVYEPDYLNQLARAFLESQLDSSQRPVIALARSAKLAAYPKASHVKPVLYQPQTQGLHQVRIGFFDDQKPLGYQDVLFSVRYARKQLTAAADLPAGTVLTADNTVIGEVLSDKPQANDWTAPYGKMVKQRVPSGGLITEAILQAPQPTMIVRKRQAVLVRIENPKLYVSAIGEALEDGAVGQIVRVKRGQRPDERVITCRVMPDGSVEPVF